MTDESQELLKGTSTCSILQALEREPMHGWGIAERIETSSRGVFRLQTGTLTPPPSPRAKGWIRAAWRTTENNRRARYYKLNPDGRKQLEAARASWERASTAVNRILHALS